MKPVLSESRMRENRMSGSMSGNVETGLWLSYLGTVRRKGRKQRSQTYRYRATSRLYLWNRGQESSGVKKAGNRPRRPFSPASCIRKGTPDSDALKRYDPAAPWNNHTVATPDITSSAGSIFAIDDQSPTGC